LIEGHFFIFTFLWYVILPILQINLGLQTTHFVAIEGFPAAHGVMGVELVERVRVELVSAIRD